jgi:hypothetical protein
MRKIPEHCPNKTLANQNIMCTLILIAGAVPAWDKARVL